MSPLRLHILCKAMMTAMFVESVLIANIIMNQKLYKCLYINAVDSDFHVRQGIKMMG